MRMDCVKFLHMDPGAKVTAFLDGLTDDELARAGTDFWLTRNGHGAGFWDGDWDYSGLTANADWGPPWTSAPRPSPSANSTSVTTGSFTANTTRTNHERPTPRS